MKITLKCFYGAILMAVMLCSCQEEIVPCGQPDAEKNNLPTVAVEFSAVTESGLPTKMTLGTGLKPTWEAGDRLAVYDGALVSEFSVKTSEGSLAKFNGYVTEGSEEYYALFPYREGVTFDAAAKAFRTVIPSEQVISQGDSVSVSALTGMAYAQKQAEGQVEFAFMNVCGLIKVDVPESGQIVSIVISGNGDETFAGDGTVSLQEGTVNDVSRTVPVFTPSEGSLKSVVLRPEGENATFEKGSYYAVVAPVEFKSGFSISMVRADGAAGRISTDRQTRVVRNGGINLKDIVTISEWNLEIRTKEQLFAWGANWGCFDKVTLMEDIDMEGDPWTPVGGYDDWFSGVFDGNGKKLYNLNVNEDGYAGFIGHLAGDGCVRNLTIGSKDGVSYDGSSSIVHTPSKDETIWSYVGVVAKLSGKASVENIINFAGLKIPESNFNVKACMGGIAGFSDSSGSISKCVNNGSVDYLAVKGNTTNVIGGIVSKLDRGTTVSECENHGKITNYNASVCYVGGIVGNTRSNNYDNARPAAVTVCSNTGALEINAVNPSEECGVGGICGMLQNADLISCTNNGKVSLATQSSMGIYVGGIAGMRRNTHDTFIRDCVNGTSGMSRSLFEYRTAEGDVKFGGILGHCHKSSGALNLIGCTNHSPITLSNKGGVFHIGGIAGAVEENVVLVADKCINNGAMDITSSATTGQKVFGGLFGYLRSVKNADFSITECTNNGAMSTSAGGTVSETDIAGIVGYAGAYLTFQTCKNYGTISTSGAATKPRPAGIAGVASGVETKFINCENWGEVSNASNHENLYIGGLVAFSKSVSFDGCSNNAGVKVTNAGGETKLGGITGQAEDVAINSSCNKGRLSFSASRQPRVGGIVGNIIKDVTITDCHNRADGVIECKTVGNTACVGGIAGRFGGNNTTSQNISVRNSSNSCAITVETSSAHSWIVGGIVGVAEHGNVTGTQNQISGCTNSGSITINSTATTASKYVRAGGIVGQASNIMNMVISDCENGGDVTISTLTPGGTHAGGVIGYTRVQVGLANNTNKASLSVKSPNSSVYVGGIWAYDDSMANGHTAKDIIGNVNYGEVSGTCGSGKELGAGGLFGTVRKTAVGNLKSDNTNYGNVTCNGGALAGISSIASWSGNVGKNVVVNGVAWSGSVTSEWLCPAADNPLAANYVELSAN